MQEPGRILSIQSHVVSGYVGNKAAVFPLQLLGFDVDVVNSVQFSNHTGYRNKWKGTRLSGAELMDLIDGMQANGLLHNISHLLTGYVGTDSFLDTIAEVLLRLRRVNPNVKYFCDPVLGDNGRLYVPDSLVGIYREKICPLASVVTPNLFELECLTGLPVSSESSILEAIDNLHDLGIETVVVTSSALEALKVVIFASRRSATDHSRIRLEVEKLHEKFTGSGDLAASLLLGWMKRLPDDFVSSCRHAMASVAAVLKRTVESQEEIGEEPVCSMKELKLIESARAILEPPLHLVDVKHLS